MKKTYAISKEQLEALPKEVCEKAKDILKAYDEVSITYEHGQYKVSACIGICANYAPDHKFIGTAYAEDIYTEAERKENFKEEFGYYPCFKLASTLG